MEIQSLKLPKGNDGRFVFTKDAVNLLKKAESITVSYNKNVPSECYIMAHTVKKYQGEEYEFYWRMPINTLEHQYFFKASISANSDTQFQRLLKPDCSVTFIPSIHDGMCTIRYIIHTPTGKTIPGVFEQRIFKDKPAIDIVSNLN